MENEKGKRDEEPNERVSEFAIIGLFALNQRELKHLSYESIFLLFSFPHSLFSVKFDKFRIRYLYITK
jgi:hypothetical protein